MNRSGLAVYYLVKHYRPALKNVLVVHDDVDLDVGRIKIVRRGGAGGHRGVESVIYYLESNGFNRIKIGLGRPRYNEPIEDFVLSPIYDDQQSEIKDVLHLVTKAIESFILDGVESAMNNFNSLIIGKNEVES